jgi:hypothetical protein
LTFAAEARITALNAGTWIFDTGTIATDLASRAACLIAVSRAMAATTYAVFSLSAFNIFAGVSAETVTGITWSSEGAFYPGTQ